MLTRPLGVCLLAMALGRQAAAQTSPEMQKVLDRLDQLEAENRQLLEQIQQLRTELTRKPAETAVASRSPAPSPAQAGDLNERMDVQESRTAELAQSKVESSQRMPVALTGMLLFNAFENGNNAGTAQYPVSASQIRSAAASGASLRQTVLGLRFNGPDLPGGGKVSGSVYMDFFAGTNVPNNNLFRLRVATLDLNWKNTTITLGQDKPIISPREPSSLAQVGVSPLTAAGNLWLWQPQVRIEQRIPFGANNETSGLRAQFGVYQTSEAYSANLPQEYAGTLERARPGYEGRFELFAGKGNRRIEIAPGFHFSSTHVKGTSVPSRVGSIDWLFRPASIAEFSGAFFRGENVAGLGALRQGFNILPSEAVIPVHSQGEWGQLSLFPAARLSIHFYSGEQHDRGADVPPNGVVRNLVYAGNFIYKLAPNVLAAIEASQTRTQYLGPVLRMNNHYDLALAYLF